MRPGAHTVRLRPFKVSTDLREEVSGRVAVEGDVKVQPAGQVTVVGCVEENVFVVAQLHQHVRPVLYIRDGYAEDHPDAPTVHLERGSQRDLSAEPAIPVTQRVHVHFRPRDPGQGQGQGQKNCCCYWSLHS